jgi:outer membrane immunogenic protein
MKKILLSTVALVGLSVAASAADLPRRSMAPAPFVAAPVFTWTGFYVGANLGFAWTDDSNDDFNSRFFAPGEIVNLPATSGTLTLLTPGTFANDDDDDGGFTGGAQIGYNVQFGQFVVGVEADIQAIDSGSDNNRFGGAIAPALFAFAPAPGALGLPVGATVQLNDNRRDLDWWGSIRARAGFAFDRALIYATAGWAFGGGGNDNNCGGFFAGGFVCDSDDDTDNGFVVGGGVEYAFTNNLTVGLEGLWVDLDRDNNNRRGAFFNTTNGVLFVNDTNGGNDDGFGVVRAKVNFKF